MHSVPLPKRSLGGLMGRSLMGRTKALGGAKALGRVKALAVDFITVLGVSLVLVMFFTESSHFFI